LKVAGAERTIFTPGSLESVYSYSGGIPRVVNVLCDNALLTAYALGKKEIDTEIIREVAEDLNITINIEARRPKPIRQVIHSHNNVGNVSLQTLSGPVEAVSGITRLEPKPITLKPIPKTISPATFVPGSFLDALVGALTNAMGPMAKIVLRDQIRTLGESSDRFPYAKVDMLIESVSREILDEGMRARFRQQMLEQVRILQPS
jgi:hypothetical protein